MRGMDYKDFQQAQQAEETVVAYVQRLVDQGLTLCEAFQHTTHRFGLLPGQVREVWRARRGDE